VGYASDSQISIDRTNIGSGRTVTKAGLRTYIILYANGIAAELKTHGGKFIW